MALQNNLHGHTDEELAQRLGCSAEKCRKRRNDLVKEGKIKDSGQLRMSRSGRLARVWVTTEKNSPIVSPPNRLGLKREEVDPHFQGTPLEFEAHYGKVNLQTKDQIESDKQKMAFSRWVGAVRSCEKPLKELIAASKELPIDLFSDYFRKRDTFKRQLWLNRLDLFKHACDAVAPAVEVPEKVCRLESRC